MGSKRSTPNSCREIKLRKFARDEENIVEYKYKESAFTKNATVKMESSERTAFTVRLDPQAYRKYVSVQGLTDREKDELVDVLMSIVQSFVDRAFGVDPTQEALSAATERQSSQDDADIETGARALRMDTNLPKLSPEGW
jgi:hypothetical protein